MTAQNKTRATRASVDRYLAAIDDDSRRRDCEALVALITKATTLEPVMWGENIVGFGTYHYRYASGREGDMCLVGFSSRKADISLYLMAGFAEQAQLLSRLGKHRMAKSCLHVRKLADVDTEVLRQIVVAAVAEVGRRHAA